MTSSVRRRLLVRLLALATHPLYLLPSNLRTSTPVTRRRPPSSADSVGSGATRSPSRSIVAHAWRTSGIVGIRTQTRCCVSSRPPRRYHLSCLRQPLDRSPRCRIHLRHCVFCHRHRHYLGVDLESSRSSEHTGSRSSVFLSNTRGHAPAYPAHADHRHVALHETTTVVCALSSEPWRGGSLLSPPMHSVPVVRSELVVYYIAYIVLLTAPLLASSPTTLCPDTNIYRRYTLTDVP